jgi:hypothetical protein
MKLQLEELEARDLLSVNLVGLAQPFVASHLDAPVTAHHSSLQSAAAWTTAAHAATPDASATDTLNGLEIFPGVSIGQVRYGVTFAGRATGSLPGSWAASINYTPPNPGANVVNSIVGGTWSLEVVRHGVVKGSLFGNVVSGTATWNSDGTVASLTATLTITGGTRVFAGVTGSGTFDGTLSHLSFPPSISGALTLTY